MVYRVWFSTDTRPGFCSGKLEPKVNFFCLKNVLIEQPSEQTGATQTCHRWTRLSCRRPWGSRVKPPAAGQFCDFSEKLVISTPFELNLQALEAV